MNYSLDDTITAVATAPGEAGIGIVRISGEQALPILKKVFRPAAPSMYRGEAGTLPSERRPSFGGTREWQPESHRMVYGTLVGSQGDPLDEVMVVWFQTPRSYTREDVVELHTHGGSVAVREALGLVLQAGARLAEAGEMTLRAFLNGRLDLAQAEAVLDMVQARTKAGLRAAMEQLGGTLSDEIRAARMTLIDVLAHLTATIDFPEDDVPPQDITPELNEVFELLNQLLRNADRGILLREGLRVAIVGRPNVGKSSLLNRLLRQERAIVTNIPGTTRDLVEESLNLRGIPIVLIDTAGIRQTEDIIEAIGVERSHNALQQADLILFALDASQPLTQEDYTLANIIAGRTVIVVENKQDLLPTQSPVFSLQSPVSNLQSPVSNLQSPVSNLQSPVSSHESPVSSLQSPVTSHQSPVTSHQSPVTSHESTLLPNAPHISVSALTGTGIEKLEEQIWRLVIGGQAGTNEATLVTNPRHKQAIQQARDHIADALESAQLGMPADFLTIDLHAAVNALGEITGETATDDLLNAIFSRFCIGK